MYVDDLNDDSRSITNLRSSPLPGYGTDTSFVGSDIGGVKSNLVSACHILSGVPVSEFGRPSSLIVSVSQILSKVSNLSVSSKKSIEASWKVGISLALS
jgi:hypothetical protein